MEYGVHWFRRDLRVAGNPALQWSHKRYSGRVVGLFCFDKKFLGRSDFSPVRFQFFLDTLAALSSELREAGSDLLFLDIGPREAFSALFDDLRRQDRPLPKTISWNRDYEPFAIARDSMMEDRFRDQGVGIHHDSDHVLIEPRQIRKESDPGSPYQVFTPFQRKWLEVFEGDEVAQRVRGQKAGLKYLEARAKGEMKRLFSLNWSEVLGKDSKKAVESQALMDGYRTENRKRVTIPIPAAGSIAAFDRLKEFSSSVKAYGEQRDLPAIDGTSRLSIYLKNGSLTVSQIIAALDLKSFGKKEKSGTAKFLSELIWREFYYYILFQFPEVETAAFQPRFRKIVWEGNEEAFELWKAGRTGVPIVDAGMRQLNTTGWMHNRVRMIVASFLTKDLLINWQWGERYFMERLLDGDLAPNNGGWQWAASTGCDAQPYFRIFNPYLQSEKFDPNGEYIRRFVTELNALNSSEIHNPSPLRAAEMGYPLPIVDHAIQRGLALNMYNKSK